MKTQTVQRIAIGALVWGLIGGWSILGQWWPSCNTLDKDQVTILFALAILLSKK